MFPTIAGSQAPPANVLTRATGALSGGNSMNSVTHTHHAGPPRALERSRQPARWKRNQRKGYKVKPISSCSCKNRCVPDVISFLQCEVLRDLFRRLNHGDQSELLNCHIVRKRIYRGKTRVDSTSKVGE
jgi:hypothetical protein